MNKEVMELPELILLEDYGGNFNDYFEACYEVFFNDFIKNKPVFEGTRLGLKKHPLVGGKAYTFYHFTHSGSDEQNREPDIRRMERISFPGPMINEAQNGYLKVWRKKIKGKNRILILHEDEDYLVVLDDRGNYILPWTAFLITYPNKKRRLLKEYEHYQKTVKAEAAK